MENLIVLTLTHAQLKGQLEKLYVLTPEDAAVETESILMQYEMLLEELNACRTMNATLRKEVKKRQQKTQRTTKRMFRLLSVSSKQKKKIKKLNASLSSKEVIVIHVVNYVFNNNSICGFV